MLNNINNWQRTKRCGEINSGDLSAEITLMGWVNKRRDLGSLIFIDLRDVSGIVQVVFDPAVSPDSHKIAEKLRNEFVIAIKGVVNNRPEDMINEAMSTGAFEISAKELKILNVSKPMPFDFNDPKSDENVRLKYRYIDLRSQRMRDNILIRHKAAQATREFLNGQNFYELETPFLIRSTPEGARDYIVPSRLRPGSCYALPQSPQIYKQIYMIAGFDRYYQIPRCFRDEDLRSDRQPEFTQIDIEMSFTSEDEIFTLTEGLFRKIFKDTINVDLPERFPQMTYFEAMERFGTDKPDMRYGLELNDVGQIFTNSGFGVFSGTLANKGVIKCIAVENGAAFSRKEITALEDIAKKMGAKGLAWMKYKEGEFSGGISKFISDEEKSALVSQLNLQDNSIVLFVADKYKTVCKALSFVRENLAQKLDLIKKGDWKFIWIKDFPLFDWNEDENRWETMHHMFTMPKEEHIEKMDSAPGEVTAQLYDIVLNGVELGSGSIRVHRKDVQEKIFEIIGISGEELDEKFGFFVNALDYGTPPHGGIAPGFDRLVMMLCGEENIRNVIAFPKTLQAVGMMEDCPTPMHSSQLDELGLIVKKETE